MALAGVGVLNVYIRLFRPNSLRRLPTTRSLRPTGLPSPQRFIVSQPVPRTSLKTSLLIAIFSRLFVFAVAIAASYFFGVIPSCHKFGCWNIDLPFLNLFSRWDSGYYADIALYGYPSLITARWEFFPFYPILMATIGRILAMTDLIPLHLAVYVAGFAISNLAFLASIYYLYKLSERVFPSFRTAFDSALLLALFPAGVFISAVYSESLFLLLTLSSLYYWRLGKIRKSSVLGFFASLTRPVGVFLAIPILYEVLVTSSQRKKAVLYVPVAVILLGYLAFMAYSQLMTRTPFANFVAERLYFGVNYNPQHLLVLAMKEISDHPITIPFLALGIGGVLASILKARSNPEKAIDLHAICLLILYLFTPPIISFPRYAITLLPIYWSLSRCSQSSWMRGLICVGFLVLLAIGTGLFVNWYAFY